MKVLLVGKYSLPRNGGVERHLDSLFQGFHAIGGVEASLLTANDGWGTAIEDWNGFRTVRASRVLDLNRLPLAPFYPRGLSIFSEVVSITPGYLWWLRKLSDVDVIHLHAPNPLAEAAILTVRPRRPLVITEHCAIPKNLPLSDAYTKIHAKVLERADAFIVQSEPFLKSSPLTSEQRSRATVIPSCLDARRLETTPEAQLKARALVEGAAPAVLFVGRLVDYKGVDFLIQAMQQAPGTLFIVGVGPEERRTRALAERLGLGRRVRFLGALDDATVMALMGLADVLVLPSTDDREGYGLVLLEAHLKGTPTISTELGTGTSWVNAHGTTGLVVPPRDVQALENAIRQIADNPGQAKAWGRAARERAGLLFSVEEMAKKTAQVYRRAVEGVGPQPRP